MDMLTCSTGSQDVDRLLQGIVGIYNQVFSARIRAFYIIGSYADGSSIALSDIDMCIIFAGTATPEEIEQAQALGHSCGQLSPIRLDLWIVSEEDLPVPVRVILKHGSLLIYGEDIRDDIALPSLDAYRAYVTWGPYRFQGQVIRDCAVLTYPLTYPDERCEFYGYERKRLPAWYPREVSQGTKELVTGILRTATAIIALKAGQYVGSKRDSVLLYREYIHDEWTDYIEALYQKGKQTWHYLIPTNDVDRSLLRSLCQRTLAFENAYFRHYRSYLLDLLQRGDDDKLFALGRLAEVVYTDQEMVEMLRGLNNHRNQDVQQAAKHAIDCIVP